MRDFAISLGLACLLTGCPRPVPPHDGGPEGCTPSAGNPFDGPLTLDDQRVSELDPACLPAGATPCLPPHMGRVTYVTDGDTLHVEGTVPEVFLMDVRMIGVDTPEIGHGGDPSDCFGDAAAEFTSQLDGRLVWLTFDAECRDRFDRNLAYVHVGDGTGDLWERQLLSRGMGRVLTIAPNSSYSPTFERDEAAAQSANTGLWGTCF
jgi:endonuclease YncB( thermonuclease family)